MLKKKSYMNIKNIINEGIFSSTLEKLFKVLMSRKANKVLKKSKRFNNSLDDLNSSKTFLLFLSNSSATGFP